MTLDPVAQPPDARASRLSLAINGVLAIVGLGFAMSYVISVLNSPFGGMRAPGYLLIFVLACVGLNRSFAFLQVRAVSSQAKTAARVAKWVLPLMLPVAVIQLVEARVLALQLQIVERELAPVIEFARLHDGSAGKSPPTVQFPVQVNYARTKGSFMVWLVAPAIDLDGFTISYLGSNGRWKRMHNDLSAVTMPGTSSCVLVRGEWGCATGAQTAVTTQEVAP